MRYATPLPILVCLFATPMSGAHAQDDAVVQDEAAARLRNAWRIPAT